MKTSAAFISEKVAADARTVEVRAEISAEWERDDAAASARLHDTTPQTGDTRPRNVTDYAALSTAENDFLKHMSRWGSDGYPVQKIQTGWIWADFCGVKGPPTVYKTRRAARAAVATYIGILQDRAAGRDT